MSQNLEVLLKDLTTLESIKQKVRDNVLFSKQLVSNNFSFRIIGLTDGVDEFRFKVSYIINGVESRYESMPFSRGDLKFETEMREQVSGLIDHIGQSMAQLLREELAPMFFEVVRKGCSKTTGMTVRSEGPR